MTINAAAAIKNLFEIRIALSPKVLRTIGRPPPQQILAPRHGKSRTLIAEMDDAAADAR
jgi:hypothetical protein